MILRKYIVPFVAVLGVFLLFRETVYVKIFENARASVTGAKFEPSRNLQPLRYIHVVLSGDGRMIPGLLATMKSVAVNAKEPQALRFYVLCGQNETAIVEEAIHCMLTKTAHPRTFTPLFGLISFYRVIEFNIKEFAPQWKIRYAEADGSDRSAPNNYARLYLHQLLKQRKYVGEYPPEKIAYLDADVIVLGDIAKLYDNALVNSTAPVAIPTRARTLLNYRINWDHPALVEWNKKHQGTAAKITTDLTAYNNGVYVQNLERWQELNITEEISHWVRANLQQPLYRFSFNPPFLLGLRGRVEPLPSQWNVLGLGELYRFRQPSVPIVTKKRHKRHMRTTPKSNIEKAPTLTEQIDNAEILHWTGGGKPWMTEGVNKALWFPYHTPQCFDGS